MIEFDARTVLVRVTVWIYRRLLTAYPPDFRREYSREMVQAFEAECRYSTHSRGLLLVWFRALLDLIQSASAERAAVRRNAGIPDRYLFMSASVVSVAGGYIHLRSDADQLAIILLLSGAFLCGLASESGAWRWAVITAAGIPLALLLGHGLNPASFPRRDADLPWPAPLLPTLIGAYSGAALRRLAPRTSRRLDRLSPD